MKSKTRRSPLSLLASLSAVLLTTAIFHLTLSEAQSPKPVEKISDTAKGKICIGTSGRLSVPATREHHYRNLRDRYQNCTYVDGNLELTWLENPAHDLSFLHSIREVTGYVLISHVQAQRIVLPNLQIIRGRTLFKINVYEEEFALLVTHSHMDNLEMPALRDVLNGSVGIYDNYNLCHIKTINWDEIITGKDAKYNYVYNFTEPERACPACHESCEAGCWGEGPENCQRFSKINCSPQCHQGRCFGNNPRECCHLFCAGGCTGPTQQDCLACRNFYDDGVCTQECPAMQKYNPITYSWEVNPEGKYAYGATCVKKCPKHLLRDNGACVRACPPTKKAQGNECVPCDGPCPKKCKGVDRVHSGNIDSFRDCTIVEGSLTILDTTFDGYQDVYDNYTLGERYTKLHPDRLEVFSTLHEITGYLNIQGSHEDFKNLSYFRNLEVIGGRSLSEYFSSLYVVKTSLESLNLRKLHTINAGAVAILENPRLCYANTINWTKILQSPKEQNVFVKTNLDQKMCEAKGMVCNSQCSSKGCWGPGKNECLSCANFKLGDHCVQSCNPKLGMYEAGEGLCKHCHHQCDGTCSGPGPGNCTRCRNVRDGPFCYAECPVMKYDDDGECQPCHENCIEGCTGPNNTIGAGGCNSCHKAVIDGDVIVKCLRKEEACPDGYYNEYMGPQEQGILKPLIGSPICRKCHPRCLKCIAYGFHVEVCSECVNYRRGEQCEDECPVDHFADEERHECKPCDDECRGCVGPTAAECHKCRNYRIYLDGGPYGEGETSTPMPLFNCTSTCPADSPHKIVPEDGSSDPYCATEPRVDRRSSEEDQLAAIIGGVLGCVFLLGIFLAVFGYQWRQRARAKENTMKMTMVMSGYEDSEPLHPTNVKPNLAKLRIVKEAELRRGGILGYGAFGTVYKGVWIPEGENVKIPVAIKVLREGTGANTSKEFLEEAYIMASVEHPNLLQLLAVCMTSQMMLVTQLMPLGCLLDYVRSNKDKIGSKPLLNWCTQIAKGMSYLEDRRLVHRDLAARNVLVQTPNCVKITDFGLAKLLDINEEEYKAAGGKMPIKWLALECIQHRIFTHKSDVWAFGVTVWELLTHGHRPYENVSARDVPELLEKGERLPQPPICTIDVYMIMIKCWMLDADSRPSFKELADEFAKMARDPGRYLVIQGDKFMRLPSYSPQDGKEFIRNLSSVMDGPEVVMDAEEYLQPRHHQPGNSASSISRASTLGANGTYTPPLPTPTKTSAPFSIGGFASGSASLMGEEGPMQNAHNWNWERRHGPGSSNSRTPTDVRGSLTTPLLHTHASNSNSSNDDFRSRYSSDPLKSVTARDSSDDSCDRASRREAQVGNIRLDLPLDEDDYLMPSPQATSNGSPAAATYMDLIGDAKVGVDGLSFVPHQRKVPLTSMDNPEYHIMNQGSSANNHTGTNPFVAGKRNGTRPPPYGGAPLQHQRSSEEESEHEYYNDFLECLQRELQPLQLSAVNSNHSVNNPPIVNEGCVPSLAANIASQIGDRAPSSASTNSSKRSETTV